MKQRNTFYDFIKGFAIIVVVLAHALQSLSSDFEHNTLGLLIYAFHMPLFMIVSGKFFLSSVSKSSISDFLRKRFMRLYIPSLMWGLFNVILLGGGKMLTHGTVELDYLASLLFTGMWFLTVLFMLSVVGALIEWKTSKYRYCLWLMVYIGINLPPDFWMRKELIAMMPFFVGSMLASKWDWSRIPAWLGIISVTIFFGLFQIFSFDDTMYRISDEVFTIPYHQSALIRIVIGACGSIAVIWMSKYLVRQAGISRVLIYLGGITLPIYVLHQKFLLPNFYFAYTTSNIFIVVTVACAITIMSIGAYSLLKKNRYIRALLFGE